MFNNKKELEVKDPFKMTLIISVAHIYMIKCKIVLEHF